jgi:hypothetical protein
MEKAFAAPELRCLREIRTVGRQNRKRMRTGGRPTMRLGAAFRLQHRHRSPLGQRSFPLLAIFFFSFTCVQTKHFDSTV